MASKKTAEDLDAIEHLLEHEESRLTAWEVEFLESIQEREWLSDKQRATLDKIWNAVVVYREREERL